MSTKRNDIHTPSNLRPTDYQHVLAFAFGGQEDIPVNLKELAELRRTQPFFVKPNGSGGCDVCGAHFRYGSVFRHVNGEHIVVGWECAEQIDTHGDLGNARGDTLSKLEKLRKRYARRQALRSFVADSRRSTDTLLQDLKSEHRIVRDIRTRLIQWGSISEAQAGLVRKLAREERERASQPVEVKVPAPEGTVTIHGTVVSVKAHESYYGFTTKMTIKVKTDAGVFLVWMTKPAGLNATINSNVVVTATLTRSDRDPSFAFGKRPRAATIATII